MGVRLVDLLAKQAAKKHRVSPSVIRGLEECALYVRYCLAKLGAVTHVANRCATTTVTEDGTTTTVSARDSEAVRPPRIVCKSRACSSPARVEMQKLHVLPPRSRDTAAASSVACAEHRRSNRSQAPRVPAEIEVAKRRRVQIIAKRHVEAIEDEVRTAKWLRTREMAASPSDASERLEALRKRVRERTVAQPQHAQQQQQQPQLTRTRLSAVCLWDAP